MPFANRCSHDFDSGVCSRGEGYFHQSRVRIEQGSSDGSSRRSGALAAMPCGWTGATREAAWSSLPVPAPTSRTWARASTFGRPCSPRTPAHGSALRQWRVDRCGARSARAETASKRTTMAAKMKTTRRGEDDAAGLRAHSTKRLAFSSFRTAKAFNAPPWFQAAPAGAGGQSKLARPAGRRVSRRFLGEARRAGPRHARQDPRGLVRAGRHVEASAGTLVIRLYHRETKLNGEFGKRQAASIGRDDLARFTRPEDREMLRLLLASDEDRGVLRCLSRPLRLLRLQPEDLAGVAGGRGLRAPAAEALRHGAARVDAGQLPAGPGGGRPAAGLGRRSAVAVPLVHRQPTTRRNAGSWRANWSARGKKARFP